MIKKILGVGLLLLGIFVAMVLLTYGGPVFPHILGPIIFVTIGAFLLLFKRKA